MLLSLLPELLGLPEFVHLHRFQEGETRFLAQAFLKMSFDRLDSASRAANDPRT